VREDIEYYSVNRAIKAMDEAEIVILLIDAAEGMSEQDKKIAAQAYARGRGLILALNKWDTMPQIKNAFQAASDNVRWFFPQMEWAPLAAISAKTGEGVAELLNTVLRLHTQLTRTVETSKFNAALQAALAQNPPPYGPSTRFKVRYGLQTQANPVKFTLFVSRPQAVTPQYLAYLRGALRKSLGFPQVPVEIEVRGTNNSAKFRE